jgi:hypothetical protein
MLIHGTVGTKRISTQRAEQMQIENGGLAQIAIVPAVDHRKTTYQRSALGASVVLRIMGYTTKTLIIIILGLLPLFQQNIY